MGNTSSSSLQLTCSNGLWLTAAPNSSLSNMNCNPHCPAGCENGGNCTEPNTCSCDSGYFGDTCSNKKCPEETPPIENGVFRGELVGHDIHTVLEVAFQYNVGHPCEFNFVTNFDTLILVPSAYIKFQAVYDHETRTLLPLPLSL